MQADDGVQSFGMTRVAGFILLVVWLMLLVSVTILRLLTDYQDHFVQPLHWFETFFRVGSLIYGGGQVVLPMLLEETVQKACWVDDHGLRVRPSPPPSSVAPLLSSAARCSSATPLICCPLLC